MRASTVSDVDAGRVGREVYTYLYPLVMMEMTRRQMTNSAVGHRPGRGPMNRFVHIDAFPTADFRVVVRPNFDTLYSSAWLDLSDGPLVVSAPDTGGRYYLLPMYDMWTDAFASPGWRTSGTGESHWAVVPPGWTGELPSGVRPIHAPTPTVWIIGRTKTDGPSDYEAVHEVQSGFRITTLSAWPEQAPPAPFVADPAVDDETEPLHQVNDMAAVDFFALGAELLKTHPPHPTDFSVLERARRIGIVPGQSFDPSTLDADTLSALQSVPADVVQHLETMIPTMARVANGWVMNTDSMGVYGNFYVKRAIVAMAGLGANQPDDAIYPLQVVAGDGRPADGSKNYVVRYAAGELPPVDAFWSITMYDNDGFQIDNPINRYAIGDRDPLRFNSDGVPRHLGPAREPRRGPRHELAACTCRRVQPVPPPLRTPSGSARRALGSATARPLLSAEADGERTPSPSGDARGSPARVLRSRPGVRTAGKAGCPVCNPCTSPDEGDATPSRRTDTGTVPAAPPRCLGVDWTWRGAQGCARNGERYERYP